MQPSIVQLHELSHQYVHDAQLLAFNAQSEQHYAASSLQLVQQQPSNQPSSSLVEYQQNSGQGQAESSNQQQQLEQQSTHLQATAQSQQTSQPQQTTLSAQTSQLVKLDASQNLLGPATANQIILVQAPSCVQASNGQPAANVR